MRYLSLIFYLFFIFLPFAASAADFPVTARLFAGQSRVKPADLNTELTVQSLENVDTVTQVGVEATTNSFKFLDWGFRYTKRFANNVEKPSNSSTNYYGDLAQDSVLFLARFRVLKKHLFRIDVFGGVGGSNTSFKIKTATQDGELTKKKSDDWLASLYTNIGASVTILTFGKFSLYGEGGIESNKVSSFDRSGTVNTNVSTIDLSGTYIAIGLMFDSVASTK